VALSDMLIRAKEPEKAAAVLAPAEKNQPQSIALLGARARVQIAMGQQEQAGETYRRILTLSPGDPVAVSQLAGLLSTAKDWDGARTLLRDALLSQPADLDLMRRLVGVDYAAGGLEAALAAINRLKADPATQKTASTLTGDLYMYLKRYDDAANAYQVALEAAPGSELALLTTNAWVAGGKLDRAAAVLRDWLTRSPDDLNAILALGMLNLQLNQMDEAVANLRQVLSKRPGDAAALNNLAWIYQLRGDAQALPLAQKAYQVAPSAQTADTLGWIMTRQGNVSGGLVLLNQAKRGLPDDPSVQYHVAYALRATGKPDQARPLLEQALGSKGGFPERADARALLDQIAQAK